TATFAAPAQKTFASLDEAVNALVAALRAADRKALVEILGPQGTPPVGGGGKVVLYVGDDDFPFPIPLVPDGARWLWDTDAGDDELLNRRIGENELSTIQVCLAYVDAQREYYSRGQGLLEYAQRL